MNHPTPARAFWRLLAAVAAFSLIATACADSDEAVEPSTTAADTSMSDSLAEISGETDDSPDESSPDEASADEPSNGEHSHSEPLDVAADGAPTLAVELVADPKGGWNLRLDTTNFTFAPERVSTDHIDGEGHAHLYIDGERHGRIYSAWYQVPGLTEGEHTLRVELSANDHRAYAVDGTLIDDTVTVNVSADAATDSHDEGHDEHDHDAATESSGAAADANVVFEVTVDGDEVIGGVQTVDVKLGSTVALVLTADLDEELHVHGFDVFADVVSGTPTTLVFVADIPGVFEAELEGRGQKIIEFKVS